MIGDFGKPLILFQVKGCDTGGPRAGAGPYDLLAQGSRPYSFEKETQKRPIFFLKRDLKETFYYQKKRPAIIFFLLQLSYHF